MIASTIAVLLVFSAAVLVDTVWAKYIETAAAGRALEAAAWSILIYVCGSFLVIQYIDDHWLLIPTCLGGALGTYLTVHFGRKQP